MIPLGRALYDPAPQQGDGLDGAVGVRQPRRHLPQDVPRLVELSLPPVAVSDLRLRLAHLVGVAQPLENREALRNEVLSLLLRVLKLFGAADPAREDAGAQQHFRPRRLVQSLQVWALSNSLPQLAH